MTSGSLYESFWFAALIGSMSPIRSAMVTSGVASFSRYRSSRGIHRIVVDLAPFDRRHPLVEEAEELAQDPGLRLAAEPEQDEVVPAQDGVLDLGQGGLVVADDPREALLAG